MDVVRLTMVSTVISGRFAKSAIVSTRCYSNRKERESLIENDEMTKDEKDLSHDDDFGFGWGVEIL